MTRPGEDIRERTFRFGLRIVKMVNRLSRTVAGYELGHQVIRSGTGIGANMQEADAAESKLDFVHKAKIALKEAQETRYWLRIIIQSGILDEDETKSLCQESDELVKIINAIVKKTMRHDE